MELAGRSERDRAVAEFVHSQLLRARGESARLPSVLLLGPRGSGKSTLLGHIRTLAQATPLGYLDLAEQGHAGAQPLNVLTELVFDLNEKKQHFPRISFPTCGLLLTAVSTGLDLSSRERAVRQLREALDTSGTQRAQRIQGVLEGLAEGAAALVGAPNWAVAPALRLLPTWGSWGSLRTRRRLARVRRQYGSQPTGDFVVTLNRDYNRLEDGERERAEEVLFDAFLTDLMAAYAGQGADRRRTTNSLLLLDNADSPLGGRFLQQLLRARTKAGLADPLVVLATAAGRPEELIRREPGGTPAPGTYLSCWDAPHRFQPVEVDEALHVGQLRDLRREEVNRHAEATLRALPRDSVKPETDDWTQWLGWIVHELTRGQPAATAAVLSDLRTQPADRPWDERLRQLFSTDLVGGLLDRLLPLVTSSELRAMMRRAAVATHLGQAGAARELWQGVSEALSREFAEFSGDPLRTMQLAADDGGLNGVHETLHPVLRFLLLRELSMEDTDGNAWDIAHTALNLRAAARIERDAEAEPWGTAYHDLASGHLQAAATYLDGRFDQVSGAQWCLELCRLRRSPVRTPGGALPGPPRSQFEELVRFLADPQHPRDRRMKAITRLLAASWISPEPRDDPAAGQVTDPYRNPLGDPYAELYPEIREEYLTLRGMVDDEADRHVFLRRAEQYRRRPWW
ncbi:hypothetical protein AN216_24755 [Streptomyces oceani]|uniref:Uncharacterized protein n=1 Tax=Streptomyces oceani TaxID=1075402 RepID=A0A1E7JTV1_9ACTN|nr:hypothetical protein AN216_24755 [Streptomyces oceani]